MRSRLGMSAYYKKKEGGGQDPSPCPGGSGTNTLTYLLTELDVRVLQKNKEGGGQDLSPCPGGSGTNTLTYLQSFTGPHSIRLLAKYLYFSTKYEFLLNAHCCCASCS